MREYNCNLNVICFPVDYVQNIIQINDNCFNFGSTYENRPRLIHFPLTFYRSKRYVINVFKFFFEYVPILEPTIYVG